MIKFGIKAILCKIACPGLKKEMIGTSIEHLHEILKKDKDNKYFKHINVCGEGGEYETLVLDAPNFCKKIIIEQFDVAMHPDEIKKEFNVYFMQITKFKLISK